MRFLVRVLILFVPLAAAFAAYRAIPILRQTVVPKHALAIQAVDMRYVPRAPATTGREMVLIFVGASTCGPSNDARLPYVLDSLKVVLQQRADSQQMAFASIGISRDRQLLAGISFLERFGPFDEIAAGHGWGNTAIAKYVFGNMPGPAATPQVLVVSRMLGSPRQVAAPDEEILMRKVGLESITDWMRTGAPMPRLR